MEKRVKLCDTQTLPNPTYYVEALKDEYAQWAFCEKRSKDFNGEWRKEVYDRPENSPLDLEIGTGNGTHFAYYAAKYPERNFVGIEWKYKPLIQSIRRALSAGSKNARIMRYDASFPEHLFAEGELDNVMIHFPDPWPKKKQKKNRLINTEFLQKLHKLQKPGSFLEFKTDNRDYFDWAEEFFRASDYKEEGITYDLHNSKYAEKNFVTHFEEIFLKQNLPIHWILLSR